MTEENIKIIVFSNNARLSQLTREEQYSLYHGIWWKNKTIPLMFFDLHLEAELEIESDPSEVNVATTIVPASVINDLIVSAYDVILLEATKEGGRFVSFVAKTPKVSIAKNAVFITLGHRANVQRQGRQMIEAADQSIQVSGLEIRGPIWPNITRSIERSFMFKDEADAQTILEKLSAELHAFNRFKIRNIRYVSAVTPKQPFTKPYSIQQEPLSLADPYNQIAELLKCTISSNYVSALVADLLGRNINVNDPDHIDKIKRELAMRTLAARVYRHNTDIYVQSVLMQHLILNKFGNKYVKKWLASGRTLKQRLAAMNQKDRNLIEKEYESQKNYLEALVANKCEHVAAYRNLRTAKTLQASRAALDLLRPYILQKNVERAATSTNVMIPCVKCNLPLICPHYLLIVELEQSRADYKTVKHKLAPFQERTQGISYCHICGEVISYDNEEETHQILDTDLSDFIMKECSFIIRRVQFPATTNVYLTMKRITEVIYTYIYEVEKRLLKSKVSIEAEVRSKKRIYTATYIYAALVHIMLKDNNVQFRTNDRNVPAENNAKAKRREVAVNKLDLFKMAISDILSVYNSTIRTIPLFTAEHIKSLYVSAFNAIGSTDMTVTEKSHENVTSLIVHNVVYNYFASFARPKITPIELLGRAALDTKYSGDVFADVTLPPAGKWPVVKNRFTLYPELPLMQDALLLFAKSLRDRMYAKNIWDKADVTKDNITEFVAVLSPPYEALSKAYAAHMIEESKWLLHRKSYYSKNYGQLPINTLRVYPIIMQPMMLSRLFDIEGKPHEWVNDKCTVCNATLKEAMSIKEDVIAAAITHKRELDNFYVYYKTRCPIYGAHEGSPCSKCGFSGARDDAYYKKYKNAYMRRFASPIVEQASQPVSKTKQIDESSYKFVSNFAAVVELASILKINKHIIEALGSTERIPYDNIASGEYNIPAVTEIIDVRLHKIIAQITYLLREYTMLRNYYHGQTVSITNFLTALKNTHNVSIDKYTMKELSPKLLDIYDKFNEQVEYFYINETPQNIHTWLIQTFCEKCLKLYNDTEPTTAVLRKEFVRYVCKNIFKFDELLSKRGWFNMAIIYGEKDDATKEKIEVKDDANVDTKDDVFTLDGYDVEVDDDGETEIKVAESID